MLKLNVVSGISIYSETYITKLKTKDIYMSIIKAALLGIIQGITEFLPISSSAHLVLVQRFLNVSGSDILLFDLSLHLGTLAAVILVFKKDLVRIILSLAGILQDLFHNLKLRLRRHGEGEDIPYRKVLATNYRRMAFLLVVSSFPTAAAGYLLHGVAELAFGSLLMPGVLLFLTAIMLLVADLVPRGEKIPKNMKPADALIAGLFQGFSVLPGLSRFGTGLSACLLAGLSRKFAVKYAMLMSVPAVLGGMVLELTGITHPSAAGAGICITGMLVSGVTGILTIRTMLRIVRNIKLKVFALYCLILGILIIAVNFAL